MFRDAILTMNVTSIVGSIDSEIMKGVDMIKVMIMIMCVCCFGEIFIMIDGCRFGDYRFGEIFITNDVRRDVRCFDEIFIMMDCCDLEVVVISMMCVMLIVIVFDCNMSLYALRAKTRVVRAL